MLDVHSTCSNIHWILTLALCLFLAVSTFLGFWGPRVIPGSSFLSSFPFIFLLSWCQACPGLPNPCSSPFLLTILHCSTCASCWVLFSPFHSISSLLSTTEVYLMYVCSFPSPLLLTWIGICHLPLGLLQHLHFEAEDVQN